MKDLALRIGSKTKDLILNMTRDEAIMILLFMAALISIGALMVTGLWLLTLMP